MSSGTRAGRYILIGPTPPPLGGVSVYVSRLAKKLEMEGHQVSVLNLSAQGGLRKLMSVARLVFDPRNTSIQLHAFDFSAMAAMIIRPFPKKLQYMDHNTAIYQRNLGRIRGFLFERILAHADEVVFVSQKALDYYRGTGLEVASHVELRSPFLPPNLEDEERILASYSTETREFVDSHSPLLVANASAILFYEGVELYGLDMCVELTERLKRDFPQVGFVYAIADATVNTDYIREIEQRMSGLGLQDNFHFITGQRELWPIFRVADLLVRPTSNDGYGISVAEALYFQSGALASDVTVRPPGTRLFRSRDVDAFYSEALAMLRERVHRKGSAR